MYNRELGVIAEYYHRLQHSELLKITAIGNDNEFVTRFFGVAFQESILACFRDQDNLVSYLDRPTLHSSLDHAANWTLSTILGGVNPIIAEIQNESFARQYF